MDQGVDESVSCPWILRSSGDKWPHCHHVLPSRLQNHAVPGFCEVSRLACSSKHFWTPVPQGCRRIATLSASSSAQRLRRNSDDIPKSYHLTIQTFVLIETRLLIFCATALRDRALELGLPQSPQSSASSRYRTSLIQVSRHIVAFSGFLGRHFETHDRFVLFPCGSTVDRQASVNSEARYL